MKCNSRQAFSLLEASIVLVMIGLLAGIIMVATGIEQRQKLRSVITDAQTYSTAIWQFQKQYGSLPGDMPNATEVWGRAGSEPLDSLDCTKPATDRPDFVANPNKILGMTCNGNANGVIRIEAADQSCEPYRVWEHLTLAKMVTGSFSGVSGLANCSPNSVASVNSPVSSIEGGTFTITTLGPLLTMGEIDDTDTVFYSGNYRNVLIYGGQAASDFSVYPILTPSEAREIDSKNDDGNPALGKVRNSRSGAGTTPNCTTGNAYNEARSDPLCAVIFMSDFMKSTDQQ